MNHRLIHDHAYETATEILATVKDCLMENEHRIAFQEFYDISKRSLEAYQVDTDRMLHRLRPMSN